MTAPADKIINRRTFLKTSAVAGGVMLATGLWPGFARASGNGRGEAFSFAVINDAHFQSPKCPAWFERVNASILSHGRRPEFCLVVGDLAEHGTAEELGAMRELLLALRVEFHVVIGNHDYIGDTDRRAWDALFPKSLNHHFEHRGWQFVGLDTSEGHKSLPRIQPATMAWLDERLPKLDRAAPTVVFTHFPLGKKVKYRPPNADDLLARFEPFNLVSVFNGHYHGFTERHSGRTTLTTNRCCAISRANHDGTKAKGYFLCAAREGTIARQFIEVSTDGLVS